MNKSDILKEIREIQKITKDFNKMKHVFSEDKGIRTLAKLNQTLNSLSILLKAQKIKSLDHPSKKAIEESFRPCGLVSIRPCADEYKDKTYIGIYIGDVALGSSISIEKGKIKAEWSHYNPGIFIPELGKVIYGCESYWQSIDSIEDLKKITNDDINKVWYVRLMKEFNKN